MKHVIIGAGISGITLAYYLKKINKNNEIIIIDKDYTKSTSYHSNNLYFLSKKKIKNKVPIKYNISSLSINSISFIFLIHFILIQILFFFYIKNINEYFSEFNFLPIPKIKCDNIHYYELERYREFINSFTIIKSEFLFYTKQKNNKIYVKTNTDEFICDYFYDCRALSFNSNFLLNISSDSIYVRVDKVKINCLLREKIYWIMPMNENILKISMNLYVNGSELNKKKINIQEIYNILYKYDMKFLEIIDSWFGSRTCSYDLIPFYYHKDNVFIITGGSFLGFNTLPAISRLIAYKVNNISIQYKYDLSINRIYKEIFFIYFIFMLIILHINK